MTGGTDDDGGAMPPGPWPPPMSPLPPPLPPVGSGRPQPQPQPQSPSEWKRPPLGAPLGVWIGVGLFLAVPVLMVVALMVLLGPASDAGFMTFEDDETGFFPFLGALVSIFLLIVAVVGAGIVLLIIAVLITVISGFARKKP